MKFIHIADLHCNKERKSFCIKALLQVKNFIKEHPHTDLFIAGDFWDSTITATETSGFTDFTTAIKEICDITSVFIITGTPSHEPAGSCDIFKTLGAYVYKKNTFVDINTGTEHFELVAMPEPRKQDFVNCDNIDKAIQQSYSDFIDKIPDKKGLTRIAMIHNEIRSASLQNETAIDETHPAAIPAELVKKINADYYACGHIHKPQKLSSIGECYYPGSIYPKNFGETHNAGFNFVSIENGAVSVERISFNFPQNITEHCSVDDIEKYKNINFSNKNVKFVIHLDKLLKKDFSKESLENKLKAYTNAEAVSIQFEFIESNATRSKTVSEKSDIIEKFKTYAKLSSIRYSDSLISKLQVIKDNLAEVSYLPNDTYELTYLSLKGAIGIKDGVGLDEIEIDFSKYKPGVLCLLGKNGSGKSTLIENAHPYPQMLTRSGALKEHFFLKDSHRILIYKTSKGKLIKITMQIDGIAKAVGTRYFVEEKEPDGFWKPVSSVDGSNEAYMNYVNSHFGDVSLFLRTAFYAKKQIKSIPDLSIATKGEKIELFSILAGTDYLSEISEAAKKSGKDIRKNIDDIKNQLVGFDSLKQRSEEYSDSIQKKTVEVSKLKELVAVDKEELRVFEDEQKKYDEVLASASFLHKAIIEKNTELDNIRRDILLYEANIQELEKQLENEALYRQQLSWYEENTEKRKTLVSQKLSLLSEQNKLKSSLDKKENETKKINTEIQAVSEKILTLEHNLAMAEKSLVPDIQICPVCGQPLDNHKKSELVAEQKKLKLDIKNMKLLKDEFTSKKEELSEALQNLKTDTMQLEYSKNDSEISKIENDIMQIDMYMETLDISEIRNTLDNSLPLLKDNQKRLANFKEKYHKIEAELNEMTKKSNELPPDYTDKINRLKRGLENSNENISTLTAEIKVLNDNLSSLKKYESQIKNIDEQIKNLNKDLKDFDMIAEAFGNTGIQAYELDNVAPKIAEITNQILKETYGDRFSVSFCTQRNSSDGKKIDDFIINVFDSVSGREKKLNLLSSGESVWIKQALYFGFSVIRTMNTGFCFKTRFLDESDGELDSEARPLFVKMIEAAHRMCNATLTILITHSVEVKDLIEQKIELVRS